MKVYLNNNHASMLDTQVLEAMQPLYTEQYTPESAQTSLTQADAKIRASLHARESDLLTFGANAEELHSRLLIATYLNYIITGQKNQIILSASESPSVMQTASYIASQGCRVTILPLTAEGLVDIELLRQTITPKTALVSITMVDAQSGAIMPIDEASQICTEHEVPLHSDATHAIGKLPIDMQMLDIAYLTLSTETVHGPSGTALLAIKAGKTLPNLIQPNHDRAGIVGMGKALELAVDAQAFEMEDVRELRDTLEEEIREIPDHLILTPWALRTPHTLMVGFKGVQSDALLWELERYGISAYTENGRALIEQTQADRVYTHTLIGFALSRYTTEEEIAYTIEKLKHAVKIIREERIK
jgi:cysteine desulfurase